MRCVPGRYVNDYPCIMTFIVVVVVVIMEGKWSGMVVALALCLI